MSTVPRATFTAERFVATQVSAGVLLLEVDGRFSDEIPAGRPRLVLEALDGRLELPAVGGRRHRDGRLSATFAAPADPPEGTSYALGVSGILYDLAAPTVEPGEDRVVDLSREVNALRHELGERDAAADALQAATEQRVMAAVRAADARVAEVTEALRAAEADHAEHRVALEAARGTTADDAARRIATAESAQRAAGRRHVEALDAARAVAAAAARAELAAAHEEMAQERRRIDGERARDAEQAAAELVAAHAQAAAELDDAGAVSARAAKEAAAELAAARAQAAAESEAAAAERAREAEQAAAGLAALRAEAETRLEAFRRSADERVAELRAEAADQDRQRSAARATEVAQLRRELGAAEERAAATVRQERARADAAAQAEADERAAREEADVRAEAAHQKAREAGRTLKGVRAQLEALQRERARDGREPETTAIPRHRPTVAARRAAAVSEGRTPSGEPAPGAGDGSARAAAPSQAAPPAARAGEDGAPGGPAAPSEAAPPAARTGEDGASGGPVAPSDAMPPAIPAGEDNAPGGPAAPASGDGDDPPTTAGEHADPTRVRARPRAVPRGYVAEVATDPGTEGHERVRVLGRDGPRASADPPPPTAAPLDPPAWVKWVPPVTQTGLLIALLVFVFALTVLTAIL